MKLKIQFSNYKVSKWDFSTNKFVDITSDSAEIICAGRMTKSGSAYVQDCELHI